MTDQTQPEALRLANVCSNLTRYSMDAHLIAAELRRQHTRIAELESELEAISAGGVNGPLMGSASLSANAGEPVAWQYRSLRDNGAWFDCTKERFEMRCTQPEIWETRALCAASPTAQAAWWRPIETAPKGERVLLWSEITRGEPFIGDWAEYARYNHPQFTHWSRWDGLPPTSAEGVEHG